jgi:hypothetical protein
MTNPIREAKEKLPLPALMHRFGLGERAMKSARCPFHDDKHNSFSTWKNEASLWFWKCHAGCGEGDEITFLEKLEGLSTGQAIKRYLELAGVNASVAPPLRLTGVLASPKPDKSHEQNVLDWNSCVDAFTEKWIEWLAKWRGCSFELFSWLKENKLIGLYNGCIAFPVHDHADNVVAVHYRLKDGTWRYHPQGAKVCPLVIGELAAGNYAEAFEGYFDAFSFMDVTGERCGIIVTRGAANGALIAGLVPSGSPVYAWKQNDELKNGKRAADVWLKDVATHAAAKVLWPKTPEQFKDLNDWTRAGATFDDLSAAMVHAEVVRGAETIKVVSESPPNESPEPGPFPLDALNPVMREIAAQSAEVYQIKPELPGMAFSSNGKFRPEAISTRILSG